MNVRMNLTRDRAALFSDCGRYRYQLRSQLDGGSVEEPCLRPVLFVMLNPSTATELKPDPTVTRCMGFARALGASELLVANLFAFRATDRRELLAVEDPVGADNDRLMAAITACCTGVAASWCPVHGDCTCPRTETGERESESLTCPLHAPNSLHAERLPATVICAWGEPGPASLNAMIQRRAERVRRLLADLPLLALATTKSGAPRHPLYLSSRLEPQEWPR